MLPPGGGTILSNTLWSANGGQQMVVGKPSARTAEWYSRSCKIRLFLTSRVAQIAENLSSETGWPCFKSERQNHAGHFGSPGWISRSSSIALCEGGLVRRDQCDIWQEYGQSAGSGASQRCAALASQSTTVTFTAVEAKIEIGVNMRTVKAAVTSVGLFLALAGAGYAQSVIATVPVGNSPAAVAVDTVTNKVYVANINSGNVSVVDGNTNAVLATIPVGSGPWTIGVNELTNRIYIGNQYSGNVSVIDGTTDTVIATIYCAGNGLVSVSVDAVANKVYVSNEFSNSMTEIDGVTNTPTTVYLNWPESVGVNSVTHRVYGANEYANTVTVMDGASLQAIAVIPIGASPTDLAINEQANKVYMVDQNSNDVAVIDGATNTATIVPVGSYPNGVVVNSVTNNAYVANYHSNSVTIIDGATNETKSIPVDSGPYDVAVNQATNRIYVPNQYSGTLTIIDGATNTAKSLIVGQGPRRVAVNEKTGKVYVANYNGGSVTVIQDGPGSGGKLQPSVTFTGAPSQASSGAMFVMTTTTTASTTATITASGPCSILGVTVTITGSSGTCVMTATWASDATYNAATLGQSTIVMSGGGGGAGCGSGGSVPVQTSFTPSDYYPSAGSSFTLFVSVTSGGEVPGCGTVTFMDWGATLGTANTNTQGQASLTFPITAGSHSFVAKFGGTAVFAPTTSATLWIRD